MNIKNITKWIAVVVAAAVLLIGCKEEQKKMAIEGTLKNGTACKVFLEEIGPVTMTPVVVDSAKIVNGKFTLSAISRESMLYNIKLENNPYPILSVINDASTVTLTIEEKKDFAENELPFQYTISGSPASEQLKKFTDDFNIRVQKLVGITQKADSLYQLGAISKETEASLRAEHSTIVDELKVFAQQQFAAAKEPSLLLYEVGYYQSSANGAGLGIEPFDIKEIETVLNKAVIENPTHNGLAGVKIQVDEQLQKMIDTELLGKPAPDFVLPDVNGKDISLSSFKGKYVLVDFWASWCQPCRQENPNVVAAYEAFKDKNFTILGVSLDRPGQKAQWEKAIKDDKLTWTNVSDLQFWNTKVVGLYRFSGIPYNVLIDPDGKIIAESLRGRQLHEKLATLLN